MYVFDKNKESACALQLIDQFFSARHLTQAKQDVEDIIRFARAPMPLVDSFNGQNSSYKISVYTNWRTGSGFTAIGCAA